ncbi:riboflavin-binding protein-like [Ambystoma mexicanum]|uniref:riboflavin-binding protein-like n=1 Tax=Ambystoma mexicanum TaxID=8296 RepID=UPI0037E7F3F7
MQALVTLGVLAVLTLGACGQGCLQGALHKSAPSPEEGMTACTVYSKASCCHANFTEQLAESPVIAVENYYWNRCGNLSTTCESYMKKVLCFYQCSPHASHWMHSNFSAALVQVPLCQSFCDGWFDACKDDLTCVQNWLTDWTIDENGNQCKNECIPYSQMYGNGTDLCRSQWGDSFAVSQSSCHCLELNESDELAFKHIVEGTSEESGEQIDCGRKPPATAETPKAGEQKNEEEEED